MLDIYVRGRVERVSPEGPIPVLHVDERRQRPGGAGSVANMLSALGSRVLCCGVRGADRGGEELEKQLLEAGCNVEGLFEAKDRPTTLKTRYMGYVHSAGRGLQQMLRADEESTSPVCSAIQAKIKEHISRVLPDIDLLLIQDMGKGMFTPRLLEEIIDECRKQDKLVVVDPSIHQEYGAYHGSTCILPNRMEAEKATGMAVGNKNDYSRVAGEFIKSLDLDFAVITLDREGMFFADRKGNESLMPTRPRSVIDVTGAGDMVAAMLVLSLACGMSIKDAVQLANTAAGMEVSRQGATAITKGEILAELRSQAEPCLDKIKTENEITQIAARIRECGESVAFSNGVFDILHLGHIELIRFSAAQADRLIIGMNSDRSVREYKGGGRPVTPEQIRARTLAAMPNVDYVVIFDDPSVHSLIEKVQPDVLIKGGDYARKEDVVGWGIVEKRGGRVLRAPHIEGYSTTELIRKIKETDDGDEG